MSSPSFFVAFVSAIHYYKALYVGHSLLLAFTSARVSINVCASMTQKFSILMHLDEIIIKRKEIYYRTLKH